MKRAGVAFTDSEQSRLRAAIQRTGRADALAEKAGVSRNTVYRACAGGFIQRASARVLIAACDELLAAEVTRAA